MNILNVASHYGGGVGAVVSGLIKADSRNTHRPYSLELCRDKKVNAIWVQEDDLRKDIKKADIVLVHFWNHPMLYEFLSKSLPPCRLICWAHKNVPYSQAELAYPDLWLDTSPIQGHGRHIWSTGDISRFLEIKPKVHEGFNVGYIGTVDYKKLHPHFINMCYEIAKSIPNVHFTVIGKDNINPPFLPDTADWKTMPSLISYSHGPIHFIGKIDDVAPYLALMDVFFYPLRPDHYGTCEQALGEAMAAGVVPVVMDNPAEGLIVGDSLDVCKNEKECVKAITFLANHTFMREHLADVTRARAREIYNIDRMIAEWNAVFEEAIKMPKRERGPLEA